MNAQLQRGRFALGLTVSLYALWGMAHNLNDILITQFRQAFELTDLEASLVQSCFYMAYLVMPVPVALFVQRFGYKRGVVTGLCLYGAGAFLFWPAVVSVRYSAFLVALFVIASGLTFLETAGTGVIVVLGLPRQLESRILLAQAFNPIGSIAGVLIGRTFIFSSTEMPSPQRGELSQVTAAAYRAGKAHAVQAPYLSISMFVFTMAFLVAITHFPSAATEHRRGSLFWGFRTLLRSRLFVFAVFAQFNYVGSQIGVWSFLIRYGQRSVSGMAERTAALYLTASLICFLVGRFISLWLIRRWSVAQVGLLFATCASLLTLSAVLRPGTSGLLSLVGVSFFMSVLFPSIYAVGLQGNIEYSQSASALMIMSIVGGAVLTALMGRISDIMNIAFAYTVPLIAFVIVILFFLTALKLSRPGKAIAASGH